MAGEPSAPTAAGSIVATAYAARAAGLQAIGIIRGDFSGKDGFFVESDKHIRAELDKLLTPAGKPAAKRAAKKK